MLASECISNGTWRDGQVQIITTSGTVTTSGTSSCGPNLLQTTTANVPYCGGGIQGSLNFHESISDEDKAKIAKHFLKSITPKSKEEIRAELDKVLADSAQEG